jgi:hypothetical protein
MAVSAAIPRTMEQEKNHNFLRLVRLSRHAMRQVQAEISARANPR